MYPYRLKIGFLWSAGSSPAVRTIALGAALLATTACERHADHGAVVVSTIQSAPPRPARRACPSPRAIRHTASCATRWRRGWYGSMPMARSSRAWPNAGSSSTRAAASSSACGRPNGMTARPSPPNRSCRSCGDLCRHARAIPGPFLTAIDEIVVMTPQVIEIRLSRPRPDLLKLFAQPEMAIVDRGRRGTGPFRIIRSGPPPLLRPIPDPRRAEPEDDATPAPEDDVRLIAESPGRAILRFARGQSDLLLGGRFETWPLLDSVRINQTAIRVDPAAGLFGLSIVNRDGFLGDAANRQALSAAFDRAAMLAAIAPNWDATDRVLPDTLDSDAPHRFPAGRSSTWMSGAAVRGRVLPPGASPFGCVSPCHRVRGQPSLWPDRCDAAGGRHHTGAGGARCACRPAADRCGRPYDSARWYLATACAPCGEAAMAAIEQARLAPTLAGRSAAIAAADAAVNADTPFIPLARPCAGRSPPHACDNSRPMPGPGIH